MSFAWAKFSSMRTWMVLSVPLMMLWESTNTCSSAEDDTMLHSAAKALTETAARKVANRDLNLVIAILLMRSADRHGSAGAPLIKNRLFQSPIFLFSFMNDMWLKPIVLCH